MNVDGDVHILFFRDTKRTRIRKGTKSAEVEYTDFSAACSVTDLIGRAAVGGQYQVVSS